MSSLLLADLAFNPLEVLNRVVHIGAAITVAGAVFFQKFALHPALATLDEEQRTELRERITDRWRLVVGAAILLLLITGFVQYIAFRIPEIKASAQRSAYGGYHMLVGAKMLVAFLAFHAAAVLTLGGAKGQRYRAKSGFWLTYLTVLFIFIIVLGAILRNYLPPAA